MQLELLEQHSRNPIFSDVTYVSGISGERIPGHRIIQASSSVFFAELFSNNPEAKVFQLPRPIQPITQPYMFDKSLIPLDPTKDEKPEDAPVKEVAGTGATKQPSNPTPAPVDPKAKPVPNLANIGKPNLAPVPDKKDDDMKSLSDKPPATLDPTRSILSLNYILESNQAFDTSQFNPLAPPKTAESNKFSLLGRLSPPITPQNCLIFYSVASSLKLKILE